MSRKRRRRKPDTPAQLAAGWCHGRGFYLLVDGGLWTVFTLRDGTEQGTYSPGDGRYSYRRGNQDVTGTEPDWQQALRRIAYRLPA